jgi:hypothetical protein
MWLFLPVASLTHRGMLVLLLLLRFFFFSGGVVCLCLLSLPISRVDVVVVVGSDKNSEGFEPAVNEK